MSTSHSLFEAALAELGRTVTRIRDDDIERLIERIAQARHVAVFGCGREGLQIKGFAMRLFHLGRSVSVVGDMTTPALGPEDLLLVTAGPGELPTALTMTQVARRAGARVLVITAQPAGSVPAAATDVVVVPAQTMADDQGDQVTSILPMGSIFEGSLFVLFEIAILRLKAKLGVGDAQMRANHTNLE
ncbi:SIS domain-containing protein [Pararobbsia silviterrae]|uniref:SIS domain-containing protein n=1 Tax=Pararobbsia silviterrae TaxID=1792498 RepID=A0A494XPW6_9BURK|nr:SIS domain-containing protein [Pararobbsia silviterrae]RKP51852.1 SIS domain-containing protein [Pararobbsia silviterrae]